jgi:hypothetical protein
MQFEEVMAAKYAKYDILFDEAMSLPEPRLMQIKNKNAREVEMNGLGIVGVNVMAKIESGDL